MDDWQYVFGSVFYPVIALGLWTPWYFGIFGVSRLAASRGQRIVLGFTPLVCLAFILVCLEELAAKSVRESFHAVFLYFALGAAALGFCTLLFALLGISARDDVLERRNPAALIAIVGALLGATFCYAGGNIGEGPGILAVCISVGAALSTWFVLWFIADTLSGQLISDRITVERDDGCGIRFAGMLAANGAILGGAAAGDWIPQAFLHDFLLSAWPALPLSVFAAVIERTASARSSLPRSVFLACLYLIVAVAWILHRGLG